MKKARFILFLVFLSGAIAGGYSARQPQHWHYLWVAVMLINAFLAAVTAALTFRRKK